MASIGELFLTLGVKADTATLKKVGGAVANLRNGLLGTAAAFSGAIIALDRFVDSSLKGVVALQNINIQTGLSIEKLQKLQQVGQLSNLALSAEQISQSMAAVQKNLAAIRLGQGNVSPFGILGIDPTGDAFSVLEQAREAIKGLDPATTTNLITQLGFSPEFINILRLTREEFQALGENTFLNRQQRADIDRAGTSIKKVTLRLVALKDQAVAKLAPGLTKLVEDFFEWLKVNGDRIIRIITKIANIFAKFALTISRAVGFLGELLEKFVGAEDGVLALAAVFGILFLAISPITATLLALFAVLEDIAVFKKGGKSLIGLALGDGEERSTKKLAQKGVELIFGKGSAAASIPESLQFLKDRSDKKINQRVKAFFGIDRSLDPERRASGNNVINNTINQIISSTGTSDIKAIKEAAFDGAKGGLEAAKVPVNQQDVTNVDTAARSNNF